MPPIAVGAICPDHAGGPFIAAGAGAPCNCSTASRTRCCDASMRAAKDGPMSNVPMGVGGPATADGAARDPRRPVFGSSGVIAAGGAGLCAPKTPDAGRLGSDGRSAVVIGLTGAGAV